MWLIDTLMVGPLTLKEIQQKWLVSSANSDGSALYERSFIRYRNDAESLMAVDIKCDKNDGNLYKIIYPEGFNNFELQEWLLSAFRISNLAKQIKEHRQVVIESAPPAAHLLQTVMDAIDQKYGLKFQYKSHYSEDIKEYEIIPAFVRLFKQRWYVIGVAIGSTHPRTCALERMSGLEIINKKMKLSKSMSDLLNPETYFEHCFGIINDTRIDAQKIRFRAFWPQDSYLRSVPIHSSQKELERNENYSDFEIYVRPTYDLKQEFLWYRDKLAIISPESF